MTLAAVILALALIAVFAIQLPPIVAFVRTVRKGSGANGRQGHFVFSPSCLRAQRVNLQLAVSGVRATASHVGTVVVANEAAEPHTDPFAPQAVCVLCLRGRDPFLYECLRGLLLQDYPHYDVLIVVDSESDPSLQTVVKVLRELPAGYRRADEVRIEVIERVYPYGALKGSALIHAARVIREAPYEVVALLDADVIPHPSWLRELVGPLQDPSVGVTFGNRWYMPEKAEWGSLIRYIWNVGAVVQMFWNRFTWGGSVALRKVLFCHRELSARWRRSLSTDTVIYQVARHHGWEARFVPTILMVNRESCSVRKLFPWITRQLLVGKLYHPGWPWVLGHGLGTSLALGVAMAFCFVALLLGRWIAFAIVLGVLLGYWAGNVVIVHAVEKAVQNVVRGQGRKATWLTPRVWTKLILAMPVTQFFNAAAIIATFFVTGVSWRGIRYRLEGTRVKMEKYCTFADSAQEGASATQSL